MNVLLVQAPVLAMQTVLTITEVIHVRAKLDLLAVGQRVLVCCILKLHYNVFTCLHKTQGVGCCASTTDSTGGSAMTIALGVVAIRGHLVIIVPALLFPLG